MLDVGRENVKIKNSKKPKLQLKKKLCVKLASERVKRTFFSKNTSKNDSLSITKVVFEKQTNILTDYFESW